jgi:hypothetical protein
MAEHARVAMGNGGSPSPRWQKKLARSTSVTLRDSLDDFEVPMAAPRKPVTVLCRAVDPAIRRYAARYGCVRPTHAVVTHRARLSNIGPPSNRP